MIRVAILRALCVLVTIADGLLATEPPNGHNLEGA